MREENKPHGDLRFLKWLQVGRRRDDRFENRTGDTAAENRFENRTDWYEKAYRTIGSKTATVYNKTFK